MGLAAKARGPPPGPISRFFSLVARIAGRRQRAPLASAQNTILSWRGQGPAPPGGPSGGPPGGPPGGGGPTGPGGPLQVFGLDIHTSQIIGRGAPLNGYGRHSRAPIYHSTTLAELRRRRGLGRRGASQGGAPDVETWVPPYDIPLPTIYMGTPAERPIGAGTSTSAEGPLEAAPEGPLEGPPGGPPIGRPPIGRPSIGRPPSLPSRRT